ncbi:hypothetical protein ROZALSC1DRAFT_21856, partial [Rozella allomycis CSF55]
METAIPLNVEKSRVDTPSSLANEEFSPTFTKALTEGECFVLFHFLLKSNLKTLNDLSTPLEGYSSITYLVQDDEIFHNLIGELLGIEFDSLESCMSHVDSLNIQCSNRPSILVNVVLFVMCTKIRLNITKTWKNDIEIYLLSWLKGCINFNGDLTMKNIYSGQFYYEFVCKHMNVSQRETLGPDECYDYVRNYLSKFGLDYLVVPLELIHGNRNLHLLLLLSLYQFQSTSRLNLNLLLDFANAIESEYDCNNEGKYNCANIATKSYKSDLSSTLGYIVNLKKENHELKNNTHKIENRLNLIERERGFSTLNSDSLLTDLRSSVVIKSTMEMKLQELELRHGNVCKELELSEFKRGVLEQDIEVLTENIRVEKNEKEEILAECLHLEDLLKKENENNKRLILQHELNIQRLNEELASSKLAILEAEKKMVAIVYENKEKLDFYEKSNALVQKELKESIELNTSIQISNTELLKGKELNEQQLNEREAQIKDLIAENESLLSMSESLNLEFNELKDKLQKTDEYGRTEIENLTKLIAQTSAEKERINEAFHRIEKENVNMSNQLDHLRLDIKKSKYHTGVHHFYIERLESKVDACEMALKDTNAELNAIKSLNRKLTSEIVEYSNMNADLKSLGQSLKDENEVFKVKCQQLEKIENQYSQLKLEHEIVKIANDQNSKMYEESKKELETISNDLTKGKLLEQEFKDEIEFWKRQNDLLQQKLLMSSNEYNICKFEYDRVQKQLTECSRQLEDANSVIKRQSECLEANEYSLEDLKITLNTNNQKYMASKDIIDDLEKKLDKKELEISKLKESISNLDLDYVSLKVRYKDQVSTNQNLSTEIQNLRSTNVELINEKEKIEAALHKKQEEFMHISTITASSGTVDLEKNILIDQIAHLNFQIDLSKKENLQLENRLSEMSSTIRTLFENEKVHVSEESQIISLEKHELDDKNIVFDKYNDLQNKYKAVEAEYRHKISGLECWLSETDVLLKQKDAKIKLLEAENNSLQNNLNDKIDALDLLRNNVKEISSYLQDLEFQLQQSKEEKCLLRQKIENEIAQYKASESNVLNLRVLNGKLLHELKNEKTLRQEAQEKLKNDEILVSKSNQISNLNQKIDSLHQQVLQLNRENSVLIIRARNFENVVHKQDSKI